MFLFAEMKGCDWRIELWVEQEQIIYYVITSFGKKQNVIRRSYGSGKQFIESVKPRIKLNDVSWEMAMSNS